MSARGQDDTPDPADDRPPAPSPSDEDERRMTAALRLARVEAAEQMDAVSDLRETEIVRLEVLEEALGSLMATRAACADLFDMGVSRGSHPRLFLDATAFVDMGRDRRTYRFQQDTRGARLVLCESVRVQTIVAAVTKYVARRLVERERALAALPPSAMPVAAEPEAPRHFRLFSAIFGVLIDLCGTALLVLLVLLGLWYLGTSLLAGWAGR